MVVKSGMAPGKITGSLQVNSASEAIELGSPEGREFLLVQCLFSPKNFLSAKFEPVAQTHERVFGAMRIKADAFSERLSGAAAAESEMAAVVERSLLALRKGKLGEYFSFFSKEGRVHMALQA